MHFCPPTAWERLLPNWTRIVATITSHSDTKARFPICAVLAQKSGGLTKRSIVNAAQIRKVDKSRLVETLGTLDSEAMATTGGGGMIAEQGLP